MGWWWAAGKSWALEHGGIRVAASTRLGRQWVGGGHRDGWALGCLLGWVGIRMVMGTSTCRHWDYGGHWDGMTLEGWWVTRHVH